MDFPSNTIYRENQLLISLLQNIFSKDAIIGTSHNFGKYHVAIQEFSPIRIGQCSPAFPLKSLCLQQLPEQCESLHIPQNSSNRIAEYDNSNGTIEWTGCPLEASFDQSIYETSEHDTDKILNSPTKKLKSLPLITARSFLSSYNINFGGKTNNNILPLWISCDSNNAEHVSWIGAYCTEHASNRAIIISSGPSIVKSLPSLDYIKKKHFLGCSTDFLKTTIEVSASYTFADTTDIMESSALAHSDVMKQTPVSIECFSNKPAQIFEMLDEDAKCNILLKISSNANIASPYVICKDLELIKMLASGIENNEIIWPPKLPDYDVYSEIKAFMEDVKYRSFQKSETKNLNHDSTNHLEYSLLGIRQELDFTDELWNLLKRCSSSEELQDNLNYIIQILKTGEVHPLIFRNNNTNIGKLARTLQQGGSEIELTGKSSFIALMEIGLQKLRRDFTYCFVKDELATQSQLSPFLKVNLTFTQSILQLTKLYNVLKIVSICNTDLQLPSTTVKQFVREALTYYFEMESDDTDHIFDFPVPYTSIRKVFKNLKPSRWQISFKTEASSYSSHTIYNLSLDSIVQTDQSHRDSDSQTFPPANGYYWTLAQFLQDSTY